MLIRQQDPQVDRIIAKVLYKKQNKSQTNSTAFLPSYKKNYMLQIENEQIRTKLKELRKKLQKEIKQKQKYQRQQKQICQLKMHLQALSKQNSSLSIEISRVRAGTLRYKESDCLSKNNKSIDLCCCQRKKAKQQLKQQNSNRNYSKSNRIVNKSKKLVHDQQIQNYLAYEPKQKQIDIQCDYYQFYIECCQRQNKLKNAQINLQSLENMIEEQEKVLKDYQDKISQKKRQNKIGQLVKTRPSTKRVNKAVSIANLHSCQSAGTIVKVLRKN